MDEGIEASRMGSDVRELLLDGRTIALFADVRSARVIQPAMCAERRRRGRRRRGGKSGRNEGPEEGRYNALVCRRVITGVNNTRYGARKREDHPRGTQVGSFRSSTKQRSVHRSTPRVNLFVSLIKMTKHFLSSCPVGSRACTPFPRAPKVKQSLYGARELDRRGQYVYPNDRVSAAILCSLHKRLICLATLGYSNILHFLASLLPSLLILSLFFIFINIALILVKSVLFHSPFCDSIQ